MQEALIQATQERAGASTGWLEVLCGAFGPRPDPGGLPASAGGRPRACRALGLGGEYFTSLPDAGWGSPVESRGIFASFGWASTDRERLPSTRPGLTLLGGFEAARALVVAPDLAQGARRNPPERARLRGSSAWAASQALLRRVHSTELRARRAKTSRGGQPPTRPSGLRRSRFRRCGVEGRPLRARAGRGPRRGTRQGRRRG